MTSRKQLVLWTAAAAAGCGLLIGVLGWQRNVDQARASTYFAGNPREGARAFREKGCARCHSVRGSEKRKAGGEPVFDLQPQSSVNQLISAMWNHAPRMWEQMRERKAPYPDLTREDITNIFAYLYSARYLDESGDTQRGEVLFQTKDCGTCHSTSGVRKTGAPDLSAVGGIDTPIRWTQAMWNHAPAMESQMQGAGLAWPLFEGREMNDLLAYIRQFQHGGGESDLLPADPGRGWKVFQEKSCLSCHSIAGKGESIGPDLGPDREVPMTLAQFAGAMWNHSPKMYRTMKARQISRPQFEGREMADLVAFLASVRYFDPPGSALAGASAFVTSGCSRCHGQNGLGGEHGPRLRGGGREYSAVALAEALWRHGPRMYAAAGPLGLAWPVLDETQVGNLVVFLNTPRAPVRRF